MVFDPSNVSVPVRLTIGPLNKSDSDGCNQRGEGREGKERKGKGEEKRDHHKSMNLTLMCIESLANGM